MRLTEIRERLAPRSAYSLISAVYEGRIARRSGVPYLNHIEEGVYIFVRQNGWQDDPVDAFCVHPIFQDDELLSQVAAGDIDIFGLSSRVVFLAMEYRRVANSYRSTDAIRTPSEIELSPIEVVNQLLVADKVQNKKDFVAKIYKNEDSKSQHHASERYIRYFDSWLEALGVSAEEYGSIVTQVHLVFPGPE